MENKNWPDEVRLYMRNKSNYYSGDESIYQYGFYDGYQYAKSKQINLREELIKFIKSTVGKKLPPYTIESVIDEYLQSKEK